MLLAGTVPSDDLPLVVDEARIENGSIIAGGHRISCIQGSGAMMSTALIVAEFLKLPPPRIVVAGDKGHGRGSRSIYEYLIESLAGLAVETVTLHYCLPDIVRMKRLCESVAKRSGRPVMIADAGFMYAAKAAGMASQFDIFTPDASELAFLADPEATHPAYISRHLFDTGVADFPALIASAYRQNSAARLLLVKGAVDYVACDGGIVATVCEPDLPALEAIGGTGDTITGLVSALVDAGMELREAAVMAFKTNRLAGALARANPATKIWEVISRFPEVLEEHFSSCVRA